MIDGLRMIEDVTFPDSFTHEILAINDGSYVVIEDGKQTLYGEAYMIRNGEIEKICEDGGSLELE